jgi:hypothetical protein
MASADPRRTKGADKTVNQALAETSVPGSGPAVGDTFVPSDQESSPGAAKEAKPASATPSTRLGAPAPTKPSSADGGEAKKSKKITQLGDFKLERKLGQGGMGTVYLARSRTSSSDSCGKLARWPVCSTRTWCRSTRPTA